MRHLVWMIVMGGWIGQGGRVEASEAVRPNILVILSDDMGFSDLGCYGGEIATPNLDALAGNGVRFTQFYNAARCCPTRASLLTGLYPHQAGMGHMTEERGREGYRGIINRQSVTIAEVLRPSGYRTYMCGKWHVTPNTGRNADRSSWPLGRGFDKYYGTIAGAGSFYDPATLTRQNATITAVSDAAYQPESYYYTDALTDNAVAYLKAHRAESPADPFFLYIAYTAAHWPLHAPEAAIARYKGRYDAGYETIRAGRLARMKELGLISAGTDLSPGAESWSGVTNNAWEARCMEVYAAMIETMDAGIGRIVAQLKASGQLDNTLILFLQDNGACAEKTGRADNGESPKPLKSMARDEVQPRIQPPMQTRDGRWVKTGPQAMPGPADTYVAYGRGWANVSNTPFREYKHWTHEGGISTPLIAHWPTGIRADRAGKLETQPGHLIDLMATCVDLAGAKYPTEVSGQKIKPREGISLRPAFNGEPLKRTQPLFWEHESNRAVRDGDWKLVAKEGKPWELYQITNDRTESHDLASSDPAKVKEMAASWDAYAARANVLPLGAWESEGTEAPTYYDQKRFELRSGDHLERSKAPFVQGKPFRIDASLESPDASTTGVILAQGGSASGYVVYLDRGRPCFAVRNGETVYSIQGPALSPGPHTVSASLDLQGVLRLEVDKTPVDPPVAGKLLARMPTDGLDVGEDRNAAVGPYTSPNPYPGVIRGVVIEVLR